MSDLPWQAALIFLLLAFAALLCIGITIEKRARIRIPDELWGSLPYSLRDKR
jgi:hypothetical protein